LICESIALDLPVFTTPLGWVRALATIRARNQLRSSLAQLSLPLLLLHGSADTVTLLSGSEHMHERSASPDKTLQIFEGYYHDLINDPGHEEVTERILQWIGDRLNPEHRNQIGIAYINADP
jgi:alpha-beta hydrolase superfamily lysophospholipase